ncbi:hypothetical protein R80B4_01455 [Fibrobacteres bacterium R8-0-B4]
MNARKSSSKKSAKKTYSSPKKSVPKLKRMTLEEFIAAMDERDARADARMAATDAKIAESQAKTDARMAESHALWKVEHAKTEAALQRLSDNVNGLAAEHRKTEAAIQSLAAEHRKTEAAQQKTEAALKDLSQTVNNGVGGLRVSIGSITEMVLLPGLAAKMNAFGHIFTRASPNSEFKRADGSKWAQVDLYLENCGSVMVVEAKTLFDDKGVNGLLERVGKLRANEKLAGVENKTIYAAAAGVDFTPEARRMIKENGIYLVQISEDNDRIDVESLPIDEAGKW